MDRFIILLSFFDSSCFDGMISTCGYAKVAQQTNPTNPNLLESLAKRSEIMRIILRSRKREEFHAGNFKKMSITFKSNNNNMKCRLHLSNWR